MMVVTLYVILINKYIKVVLVAALLNVTTGYLSYRKTYLNKMALIFNGWDDCSIVML
jgi:general stress protein CsbA